MSIKYSDGNDIEAQILKIVQTADDLRSFTLVGHEHYASWPVRYHLTPVRSNLVRHLDFKNLDVLELGAGMGGVSRFVAENCKSLRVVEGTQARFDVLSARLRDLKNWDGTVANLQDVPPTKKFDVVCLFGVLEYSELYVKAGEGLTSHESVLKSARQHLRDDGVLLIAIENQLGLKYWSGAAEDHLGTLFSGICDYPARPSARTFPKAGIRKHLAKVGMNHVDFHYPWPDYKIPASVLSEKFYDLAPEVSADLATGQEFENYDRPRFRAFSEVLTARSLARAGLLAEFSNSFLVFARASESSATFNQLTRADQGEFLGVSYSSYFRKLPIKTEFHRTSSGLESRKVPIFGNAQSTHDFVGKSAYKWKAAKDEVLDSAGSVRERLHRHAYFEDWEKFESEFLNFLQLAMTTFSSSAGVTSANLSAGALDALYTNAVFDSLGSLYFFDLEWTLNGEMEKVWFVFRNVMALGREPGLFHSSCPYAHLKAFFVLICNRLGISTNDVDLDRCIRNEADFQSAVLRHLSASQLACSITYAIQTPFLMKPYLKSPAEALISPAQASVPPSPLPHGGLGLRGRAKRKLKTLTTRALKPLLSQKGTK